MANSFAKYSFLRLNSHTLNKCHLALVSGYFTANTHSVSLFTTFRHVKWDKLCKRLYTNSPKDEKFSPKKCLLMKKITRYQYEKQKKPLYTESQLKQYLLSKGSDYTGLVERHDEYTRVLDKVHEHLLARGLTVHLVDRQSYNQNLINWADLILTVGGDGTFLMAASKVRGQSKPVIGINADPKRSEGYLCLPEKFSINHNDAIDRLINGNFKWKWRQRIRLTMSGKYSEVEPVDLHDQELLYPEHRFWEHVKENEMYCKNSYIEESKPEKVLPIFALNDVYIGESLSARVSFYEISVDGSEQVKQKSSGVTVCTGTGSTSWFFSINNLYKQSVRQILKSANEMFGSSYDVNNDQMLQKVTTNFNNSLIFDPSEHKIAYAIRDPLVNGIFSVNEPRGFCKEMSIKSRMWDAWVVVDGGTSYHFNDGAVLKLQVKDCDALKCIELL